MGYPEAQYVIDELKKKITNIPAWINDYKIWGEDSYVFNIPEMLDAVYLSEEGVNDKVINSDGLEYAINNGGTAFNTWLRGIASTKDQADTLYSDILTPEELVVKSNVLSAILNDTVVSNAIGNSSVMMNQILSNSDAMITAINTKAFINTFSTNKNFLDAVATNETYSNALVSSDYLSEFLSLGEEINTGATYTDTISERIILPEVDNTYYFLKRIYVYNKDTTTSGGSGTGYLKTSLDDSYISKALDASGSYNSAKTTVWNINKLCKTASYYSNLTGAYRGNVVQRFDYVKITIG